jgi:hypothetical protein
MKCGRYTITATTGIYSATYSGTAFANSPLTLISASGETLNLAVSTIVYNQTTAGFTTLSIGKDANAGQSGATRYYNTTTMPGVMMYASFDNTAINNYNFNNRPIIQGGTFTTNASGVATVSFTRTFTNAPVVCVCPTGTFTNVVACSVNSISTSQFSALAYQKDSRSGEKGGGLYAGTFNYIAIDNTAVINYRSTNNRPIIQCGTFSTTSGSATITFTTAFPSGQVNVFTSPTGATTNKMIYCTIRSNSLTSFTALSYFIDGNNGGAGGGVYSGAFNYIAINF